MARNTQPNLFRYPFVIVIWNDAHARNQAVEYTEDEAKIQLHRGEVVRTGGFLLKEDEVGVSLYNEETGPDSVRGLSFVPHAMIIEVIRIGYLKRPRKPRTPPA
jgi:hypothetical protein